jgi:hypothetical protein
MPWQRVLRERAAELIGRVASKVYLGMAKALERWTAIERLDRLQAKTLMIAAEHDFTPLAEKMSMAKAMRADIAIVHGSRHGIPSTRSKLPTPVCWRGSAIGPFDHRDAGFATGRQRRGDSRASRNSSGNRLH